MADKFIFTLVKDIIFNPTKAWESIISEDRPVNSLRDGILLPLIIIISVSAFGGSVLFADTNITPFYSVFKGIKCFIVFMVTVYGTSFILKEITNSMDLGRSFLIAFRLVTFSIIPLLLCQVFSRLFESLLFVDVLAVFGFNIFWIGAEKMLNPPKRKRIILLIATTAAFIAIFVVSDLILSMIIDGLFHIYV